MRLLLDTHIFLWYITDDERLPHAIAGAVRDGTNDVYLSVVSVWEALLKHQTGKLPLPGPADEYLRSRRERHLIAGLPLEEGSLSHVLTLPMHHRDPFDRILISQAIHHGLAIATVDDQFSKYPVSVLR
jgi:PIN domain nuclease of toxin-antitoxin system